MTMSAGAEGLADLLGPFASSPQAPADGVLLTEASNQIRVHCGWHIWPVAEQVVTLDGSGSWIQMLPSLRVVDVLEVLCDGEVFDVHWSANGWLQAKSGRFPCTPRSVQVRMVHGHDTVADLAPIARAWAAQAGQPLGRIAAQASGPDSVRYALPPLGAGSDPLAGLTPQERAVLARYELPPRP